jgi:ankyrin repeat protein
VFGERMSALLDRKNDKGETPLMLAEFVDLRTTDAIRQLLSQR